MDMAGEEVGRRALQAVQDPFLIRVADYPTNVAKAREMKERLC
jgi:hypothetical protein